MAVGSLLTRYRKSCRVSSHGFRALGVKACRVSSWFLRPMLKGLGMGLKGPGFRI